MYTTSAQEIRQALRAYFAENLPGWSEDTADSDPLENNGLDSTGIVMLVLYLEETYGIQILDEDLTEKNLGTIDGLLAFLGRKTASDS